jgi:electron transfer flavoprotein alpha subunit
MLAQVLGLPFVGPALDIELDRRTVRATLQTDGATEVVEVALPAVVAAAERSCKPAKADPGRWPPASMVRTWSAADAGDVRGEDSPTEVTGLRQVPRTRRRLRYSAAATHDAARAMASLDRGPRRTPPAIVPANGKTNAGTVVVVADGTDEAGRRALLGEMAALAAGPVVYVGPQSDDLVRWGADDHLEPTAMEPRPVAAALADRLRADGLPWAVVGGSTSWERETLSRLAVHLDAGLMSDLTGLAVRSGRLVGYKPAGTDTLAEIVCSGPTQIATVRTGTLPLRLPREPRPISHHQLDVGPDPAITRRERVLDDSYDALDRADVVIGVGQGVRPDEYDLLAGLRELLGAELAATRKVTDQGWLPHSRQVGITARSIAPRLYISIGASGNLNHLAGVQRAELIVAINSDPAAPVFDASDIGIVGDWRSVVPALVAETKRTGRRARLGRTT